MGIRHEPALAIAGAVVVPDSVSERRESRPCP
jgi:hypothetical protein